MNLDNKNFRGKDPGTGQKTDQTSTLSNTLPADTLPADTLPEKRDVLKEGDLKEWNNEKKPEKRPTTSTLNQDNFSQKDTIPNTLDREIPKQANFDSGQNRKNFIDTFDSELQENATDKRRTSVDDLSPANLILEDVITAIDLEDNLSLETQITQLHPADTADLFELLTHDKRIDLVGRVGPLMEAETLTFLEGQVREEVMSTFTPEKLGQLLADLETDDAVDLIQDFDEPVRQKILTSIPALDRALIEGSLAFPEESAGRLMSQDFVTMPASWTVGKALDYMSSAKNLPNNFYDVYVQDLFLNSQPASPASRDPASRNEDKQPDKIAEHPNLVGILSLSQILRSSRTTPRVDIMRHDLHAMAPTLNQEEAAYEFRKYGLVSAPVVDDEGSLLGIITIDDIVHVMDEEAQEDLLKFAGLGAEADFFARAQHIARMRFPWLLLNLATAVLASIVIGLFSASLEKVVALAILMPIVASMGGNAGTQTLAVAIRAMATRDLTRLTALKFISKEIFIGSINGLLFSLIVSVIAWFWFNNTILALVMGTAMVVNMFIAALGGAIIPLALDRFGIDPANASGVFLTTLTDVVGFVSFLGLAAALIH